MARTTRLLDSILIRVSAVFQPWLDYQMKKAKGRAERYLLPCM
jgi:hypothetical protein